MTYSKNDIHELDNRDSLDEKWIIDDLKRYLEKYHNHSGINTSIIQFVTSCRWEERFREDYERRKSNTLNWNATLKHWIDEITFCVEIPKITSIEYQQGLYNPLIKLVYDDAISGNNPPIQHYVTYLSRSVKNASTNVNWNSFIQSLIAGVTFSAVKDKLKGELNTGMPYYSDFTSDDIDLLVLEKELNQIVWLGDVTKDLSYIFWELEKRGLIQCKTLALTLSKVFKLKGGAILNTAFSADFAKLKKGNMPRNAIELDEILPLVIKSKDKSKKL